LSREIFLGDFILVLFTKTSKKFDVNSPERAPTLAGKSASRQYFMSVEGARRGARARELNTDELYLTIAWA
jgi:hypothetical protein